MQQIVAKTTSLSSLGNCSLFLKNQINEQIGVVYGSPGFGKTTAAKWACAEQNGIYLECRFWTKFQLVQDLAKNVMRVKVRDFGSGLDRLIENLALLKRPIFLDEANRICSEQLIETVRTIHDNADIPVILIGDHRLPDLLSPFPQFRGRIQYFLEIGECTLDDALLMSRVWATTPISESLVAKIHAATGGNLRGIKTALVFLDSTARTHGWEAVTEKEWESRPFSPEVSNSPATRIKKQQRRAS